MNRDEYTGAPLVSKQQAQALKKLGWIRRTRSHYEYGNHNVIHIPHTNERHKPSYSAPTIREVLVAFREENSIIVDASPIKSPNGWTWKVLNGSSLMVLAQETPKKRYASKELAESAALDYLLNVILLENEKPKRRARWGKCAPTGKRNPQGLWV